MAQIEYVAAMCNIGPGSKSHGSAMSLTRAGFEVRDVDNKDEVVLRPVKPTLIHHA